MPCISAGSLLKQTNKQTQQNHATIWYKASKNTLFSITKFLTHTLLEISSFFFSFSNSYEKGQSFPQPCKNLHYNSFCRYNNIPHRLNKQDQMIFSECPRLFRAETLNNSKFHESGINDLCFCLLSVDNTNLLKQRLSELGAHYSQWGCLCLCLVLQWKSSFGYLNHFLQNKSVSVSLWDLG